MSASYSADMSVYLVTWNLNKEGAAYSLASRALHARLDKTDNRKIIGLESVRLVATTSSPKEVYEYLVSNLLDANDKMVVVEFGASFWGNFSDETNTWIQINR